MIVLTKGTKVSPRIRGNNLVTRYGFPEESCVIPKKVAYMDEKNWANVVKVVVPGIRKIKVNNVDIVFPMLFSIYLTRHLCPANFTADYM